MPFHTNRLGLGKRHWNLETSSAVVEFLPPYLQSRFQIPTLSFNFLNILSCTFFVIIISSFILKVFISLTLSEG